jgi:uncharacterized protein
MRPFLLATLCLLVCASVVAQTTDSNPATRDDVILYLQTMHSNDMIHKVMEVMSASTLQSMHDEFVKQKGLPADFDARMRKWIDDLMRNMPVDEMEQAMIPAYQKHFTHGDIEAMNAFYSSPVGQKVLHELPDVMQEGMQAMRPALNKYVEDWKRRMMEDFKNSTTSTKSPEPAAQN